MGKPANPDLAAVWRGLAPDCCRERGRMVRSRKVWFCPDWRCKRNASNKRYLPLLPESTVRGGYRNDCRMDRALCVAQSSSDQFCRNSRPNRRAFCRGTMAQKTIRFRIRGLQGYGPTVLVGKRSSAYSRPSPLCGILVSIGLTVAMFSFAAIGLLSRLGAAPCPACL